MPGHYVMAYASVASVSVNIWFPSITGQTPGSIDPIFLWLIGKVPFDDQLRCSSKMATIDSSLLWLIGVTTGKFLSMISSATHPRWQLRIP
jgi:hypothetical protein